MSTILLRLGLWTLIVVLALFVIAEAYRDRPVAEMIPTEMLQQALVVAAVLVVAGVIARIFGKGARAVMKNRCTVCRTPIPSGAMYCRAHLRSILHEEEDKRHVSREHR